MALTRADRRLMAANLAGMRGQMRRTTAASYVAQGYDINHPVIQAMLQAAKSEEERAAIIMRYGG